MGYYRTDPRSPYNSYMKVLKEKKMQSKCMFRVVDDDIESLSKIVPDIYTFFIRL